MTTTADTAANAFKVREFKRYSKNTLVAFLVLEMPSGLIIHGCSLHQKNDSRWVGMPAKEYLNGGEKTFAPIIEFADKETRQAFQELALAAIDEYLQRGSE